MVHEPTLCMYASGHSLYICNYNCKHHKNYNSIGTSVVVCTDLSGKEPHKLVGVDKVGRKPRCGNVQNTELQWLLCALHIIAPRLSPIGLVAEALAPLVLCPLNCKVAM